MKLLFLSINEHLTNLYAQGEITQSATIRNFRIVQKEGNREVTRNIGTFIRSSANIMALF